MDPGPMNGTLYEFVIEGELDDRFGIRFEGLELQRRKGTTVLAGRLVDQAQLSGVLAQIQELGLELVSVNQPQRRGAAGGAAVADVAQGSGEGGGA